MLSVCYIILLIVCDHLCICDCRAVDLEEVKILRQRVMECQRREEVNHPQRCREDAIAYMTAFKKYKSQGMCLDTIHHHSIIASDSTVWSTVIFPRAGWKQLH